MADVMSSNFTLMLQESSNDDWVAGFARMTYADGAAVVSWIHGKFNEHIVTLRGCTQSINPNYIEWIERLDIKSRHDAPMMIEDLAALSHSPNSAGPCPINSAKTLFALVDSHSAYIAIIIERDRNSPPWSAEERKAFEAYLPYSQLTMRLHKRFDSFRGVSSFANTIFNSSPNGVIALDSNSKIQIANYMARTFLERQDALSVRNERVFLLNTDMDRRFQHLVSNMPNLTKDELENALWLFPLTRKDGGLPYQLTLQLVDRPDSTIESEFPSRIAVMYIIDPKLTAKPTEDQIQQFYDLTEAQARVALALYDGSGIQEAADNLSISVNTARSHLRSIYAKIGARTHAEMISILKVTQTIYQPTENDKSQTQGIRGRYAGN